MDTTHTPITPDRLACTAADAARLVGVSRSHWWKLHSAGKVPLPVYIGTKAPRWRVDELRAWLAAGCPDRQTWQRMRGTRDERSPLHLAARQSRAALPHMRPAGLVPHRGR